MVALSRNVRRPPWQIDNETQRTIPRRPVGLSSSPTSPAELERRRTGGTPGRYTSPSTRPPSDRGQSRPAPRQIAPSLDNVDAFAEALKRQYGGQLPSSTGLGGAMSNLFAGGTESTQYQNRYAPWLERFDAARENIALNNAIAQGVLGGDGGAGGGAGGGGGGGAASPDYTAALNLLNERLAGVGARYAPMYEQLASAAAASTGQINDATAQALARLSQVDPEAAFQWAVQQSQTPGAAGMDYLQAIGANPADVEAVRALNDALLAQQLAVSQQAAGGYSQALAAERAARQAASALMQQEALQNLAAQQAAMRAKIADAERAARQSIEDEILQYQLAQAGG